MRYFWATLTILILWTLGLAGLRGRQSERSPLEIFPDMARQPLLRPQEPSDFFPDGRGSRAPVPGTIAQDAPASPGPEETGLLPGTTNYVAALPCPVTPALLERGRQRYNAFCAVCHGAAGDGKGAATSYGLAVVANLHEPRIIRMPDGQIFDRITRGWNLMPAQGARIPPDDRWAIAAYVRALELSRLAAPAEAAPPQGGENPRKNDGR
ncbi:MAG: cytochrome c [Verrucomicrobia bacterium]|nr:cytochrome c [Verrucomicrobiota bacterium]